MKKQDWKGKHLDKDILSCGERVYSPDTCCFVSMSLNNAFYRHKEPKAMRDENLKGEYVRKKVLILKEHLKSLTDRRIVKAIRKEITVIQTA